MLTWADIHDDARARGATLQLASAPPHWRTLAALAHGVGVRSIFARGTAATRADLAPLAPAAAAAVAAYLAELGPSPEPGHEALDVATGVCVLEAVGLDAGGALASLAPLLPRVLTERNAEAIEPHWKRAFIALALDEPSWRRTAGLAGDDVPRPTPGATFEWNVQGFLRHMGGVVVHQARGNGNVPTWRDFLQHFPGQIETRSADLDTLLWATRVMACRINCTPVKELSAMVRVVTGLELG
jgi:hypothetical protein